MRTLEAVKDKIIVELDIPLESKTESGLFIPETAVNEPQKYGKVVSIGEEVSYRDKLNIGDIISFHGRAGQDIILNRKIFKVLLEGEVYGIIKETN